MSAMSKSHGKGHFVRLADLDRMSNFSTIKVKRTVSKFGSNPVYWLTMKPKLTATEAATP